MEKNQDKYNIDTKKLGVYAASANVTESLNYLMGTKVSAGIKAAVLYYGAPATGPFRKDLPVFFVISEGDVRPGAYGGLMNEVLKNNAPWTIKMGTGMPHAFDAFADNDNARKIIEETISFWKKTSSTAFGCEIPALAIIIHRPLRDALGFNFERPVPCVALRGQSRRQGESRAWAVIAEPKTQRRRMTQGCRISAKQSFDVAFADAEVGQRFTRALFWNGDERGHAAR